MASHLVTLSFYFDQLDNQLQWSSTSGTNSDVQSSGEYAGDVLFQYGDTVNFQVIGNGTAQFVGFTIVNASFISRPTPGFSPAFPPSPFVSSGTQSLPSVISLPFSPPNPVPKTNVAPPMPSKTPPFSYTTTEALTVGLYNTIPVPNASTQVYSWDFSVVLTVSIQFTGENGQTFTQLRSFSFDPEINVGPTSAH